MTRVALLSLMVAASAFAAKPRGTREELVQPVAATPVAAQDPVTVISADLGVGVWSSSLVGVGGLELGVGVGRRIGRHLVLSAELGAGLSPYPSGGGVLMRFSLSGVLAWDVLELQRQAGRALPFELGPELGLGTGLYFANSGFAVPLVQVGAFGRYVFSPALSLGLRLRGQLPFWSGAPQIFTGDRYIGAAALEPAGFTATASLLHTF
ncbi:MAG: hypothetical protein ABTQ32_08755 [Myxococcaceae bacterium]